jgi:hypothetical protein
MESPGTTFSKEQYEKSQGGTGAEKTSRNVRPIHEAVYSQLTTEVGFSTLRISQCTKLNSSSIPLHRAGREDVTTSKGLVLRET